MRMSVYTYISFALLFLASVQSAAQLSISADKPPRDAADLTARMTEIIDHIDSPAYATEVSWPEHIVLCYQLSRGGDPSLLEFTVLNDNRNHIEMDRHIALAIAIAGDREMPSWDQIRTFLANRSALDFRTTPGTRSTAQTLASATTRQVMQALELAEKNERSKTGPLPAPKPRPVQKTLPGVNYNTYYGFLHAHSNLSDGSGGPDEAYSYARDVAGLDFFALTDHGVLMIVFPWQSSKYKKLLRAADNHDAPGSFAALYGFEWSHPWLGHINVMNVRSFTHVLRRLTLNSIYRWVGDRVYSIARYNHPGRQDDTNSEFKHFRYEPYVANNMVGLEVWNKGHHFDEQFYLCTWGSCQAPTFMDEGIRKGWRLGPLGGGDNHHREWGTNTDFRVAVLATSLSRENIINAYFDRRFYATEDKNLRLDVRVGGNPMGSRLTGWHREIRVEASDSGSDTFSELRFYRDGHLFDTAFVGGNNVEATFTDPGSSGSNHYYVVAVQSDGNEAVSSPIYMNGAPPPPPARACFTQSCTGFSCTFDASCSTGEGGIVSYDWNFGDGTTATGPNVSHSFAGSGTYTVRLTVTDTIGQTHTTTQQVSVTCGDTTRPNVSMTAPANGAIISGNTTFSANATDNVGVDKVQFRIGSQILCTDHSSSNSHWSCVDNVDNFPTGDYQVRALAFDECGNFRASSTRTVRIVSNPEMAVSEPVANTAVSGNSVAISGWATDPDRVTSLTITLDNSVTIPVTYGTPRAGICQSVPVGDPNCPDIGFDATFNSTLYENGPHSLAIVATDATGKQTTKTINFTINNAPVVECTPGPNTLCLQNDRFKVEAFYVSNGTGQPARARSYSDKSGFFWFFSPDNIEVGVKVLGPVNGNYWVFHGAGTDREYTLAVTDTVTGEVRSYVKPGGSFCGDADTQAFPASASRANDLPSETGFQIKDIISEGDVSQKRTGCTPSSTRMCLQDDRFQVEVLRSGVPQPAVELTSDSGTVWFFNADNAEVFVKVLDGRNFNDHFWVFYGSMTDRDYTVRVVDTLTGQEVTYDNALGNNCGNGDVSAFFEAP